MTGDGDSDRGSLWHYEIERSKAEGPPNIDLRWIRHPIGWTRWRIEVHRKGPYAPDFNEFRLHRQREAPGWEANNEPIEPE